MEVIERLCMLKRIKYGAVSVLMAGLLSACSMMDTRPPAVQYDFGPLQIAEMGQMPADVPSISTKVYAPEWMEENLMMYRLDYVNPQQIRFYTESTWTAVPSRLFKHRLDSYLMSVGNRANSVMEGETLTLQIVFEDFSQHFSDESHSTSRMIARVALFKDRTLIAQQRFTEEIPTDSADAMGGAKAFAKGSDAMIANIMNWVAVKHH